MSVPARPARTWARLALGATLAVAAHGVLSAQQQQPPLTFRSQTELVAVDVQVIDRIGQPIAGLTNGDFQVSINGRPRKVLSADLVTYPIQAARRAALMASVGATQPGALTGIVPNLPRDVTGRVVVLAVDEASLTLGSARQAMNAAKKFVKGLSDEDVVGVYAFPFGPPKLDLLHDHFAIQLKLDKVTGRFTRPAASYNLTLSEVVDITAGDQNALDAAVARECNGITNAIDRAFCAKGIYLDAFTTGSYYETQYMQSMGDFRLLLEGLHTIPGRKTVVFISGGLAVSDRPGGKPDVSQMIKGAVKAASTADVSIYTLHIDSSLSEVFSPANKPSVTPPSDGDFAHASVSRMFSLSRDLATNASGLERLAGDAGGALFRDQVGAGEFAFDRILKETSAFYLLGVESTPADRDGRVHYIHVKANAKGATIRSRTELVIPRAGK